MTLSDPRIMRFLNSLDPAKRERALAMLGQFSEALVFDAATRGMVLISTIETEVLVDQIILEHFCSKEDQPLFAYTILHGVPLSRKITILGEILKHDYPSIYRKRKKLFKQLDEAARVRNKLAHSAPHYPGYLDHLKNEKVPLQTYEKGKLVVFLVTPEFVKKQVFQLSDMQDQLREILLEVQNRKKGH